MTNRRNFVKQAAAVMAMAAMPGVIQSASEEREKGLTLKRSQIKVDDQWEDRKSTRLNSSHRT